MVSIICYDIDMLNEKMPLMEMINYKPTDIYIGAFKKLNLITLSK